MGVPALATRAWAGKDQGPSGRAGVESRPRQSLSTHLLFDALQALAQLVPLTGEVLVATPDLLDLLQDVMDIPAREGGRCHQGEVEEKVEQPAKPARTGRGGRGGGGGGGGPAAVAAPVRLVLRVLRRVRRGRLRLLLRRRRLLRHVIRAARRVGALVRGARGAVAALGAPLFGRGHGGGGGAAGWASGARGPGRWLRLPRGLRGRHAGAAASERPGTWGDEEGGRPRKEEGAWLRRRRGADPASREGRPSPARAPATQAGRRPSSLRSDPAEGGRGPAGRGWAWLPGWPSLPVPGLPSRGVSGMGLPLSTVLSAIPAGRRGEHKEARKARLWKVGTGPGRDALRAHCLPGNTPPLRPPRSRARPCLFPRIFRLEGLCTQAPWVWTTTCPRELSYYPLCLASRLYAPLSTPLVLFSFGVS